MNLKVKGGLTLWTEINDKAFGTTIPEEDVNRMSTSMIPFACGSLMALINFIVHSTIEYFSNRGASVAL